MFESKVARPPDASGAQEQSDCSIYNINLKWKSPRLDPRSSVGAQRIGARVGRSAKIVDR